MSVYTGKTLGLMTLIAGVAGALLAGQLIAAAARAAASITVTAVARPGSRTSLGR